MINEFLGTAIKAVESSGKLLVQYFEKLHDSRQKNKNTRDLVTEVDLLSEENIKGIISSRFPKHNIILAMDDDREGEGIAWHICEVFNLPIKPKKRIVFDEFFIRGF